jgi:hypothetical protein
MVVREKLFCFDSQDIFHSEFVPEGKTVNEQMHITILRRLGYAVRRKRPEGWRTNSWFALHDNAPAHRPVLVKDFLEKNNMTTLEHPPPHSLLAWIQLIFTRSLV